MQNAFHINKSFFRAPLTFDGLHVLQIGRMFCSSNTEIDTHVHLDFFELTVVTDGEGLIYANGVATQVKKGDIFLSLPCDAHRIQTDPKKLLKFDFFAFNVKGGCFEETFELLAQNYGSPHSRMLHDDRIRPLISNAIAELDEESPYKNELLTALFRQILIYTVRGFQQMKPHSYSGISQNQALCYKLMNYIDTHIYTMKNLNELAAFTGYSYGYLSALFRQTTSNTLSGYFQEKKLDTARLLLLEHSLGVTEISDMLNYASVYAFSKAFRNFYGLSPTAYAKMHQ